MDKPTPNQIYCMWVHFQWATAWPSEDYYKGCKVGFEGAIDWMIEEGYLQLTDKGKNYKPHYKETVKQ